ncbi:ABC transporter ATP-binding protein [Paenibacillus illinoisensis]|uniref:ABC transporter ATP-binding protein n=1 Tax=Paenibacillus illinoisensis TaxID=59845 RepID=UPI001C8D7530|nr:ABC transporter ATP-binding protein [Paenibacillus illinoisensis]MBY0220376.1 ABC transporter ATP-binding protein [Paenibacillus illinoisensis]
MSNIIVEVNNVSMKFNLYKEKISSFKEYLIKLLQGKMQYEEFWALREVSITIEKGEIFGVIGYNGAGKSTFLKLVSGIMKPAIGSVKINGSIAPLIELGAGFDPELSARENIFLNGAVLGYSKYYMEQKFQEIISFSELEEFVDIAVKNYSSGMYARLGFSIATSIQPDILIVDEILSVGDIKFQEKSLNKIKEMIGLGTTVILVSHNLEQIKSICNRVMWLEKGEIRLVGEPEEVVKEFLKEGEA